MQTVFALVFVSLVSYSYALECYSCNSLSDKGCSDPFVSSKTDKCSMLMNACYKIKATQNGQEFVSRTCGLSIGENKCQEYSKGGASGSLCICSGDRCNGASHAVVGPVGFLATSIVAIYYLL